MDQDNPNWDEAQLSTIAHDVAQEAFAFHGNSESARSSELAYLIEVLTLAWHEQWDLEVIESREDAA